jgi:hypothetical protein
MAKGLSVSDLISLMTALISWGVFAAQLKVPSPPASDTAATSFGKLTYAMPANMIGYFTPNISVILVRTIHLLSLFGLINEVLQVQNEHFPHRKGTGTDCRDAYADICQFPVNQAGIHTCWHLY